MSIRILSGDEALSSLSSDRFLGRWQSLYDDCPWSTGCQSPAFATAWYEAYAVENDPLFVVADCPDKPAMEGLLALALERKSGRIVNVGGHQAEYDCWIARPDLGDEFIRAALSLLRERYPDKALCFRYLPPSAPVRWLTDPGPLSGLISSRRIRRPLINLGDATRIEASFRKRSNRSRLNRLRKLCGGEIVFRKIATEAELEEFIDEIARCTTTCGKVLSTTQHPFKMTH